MFDFFGRDVWSYLSGTEKPIVMYGTGNGADKILSVCQERGIHIQDFFASDGFVRSRLFHEKKVLSFADIKEKYKEFIVIVSFASSLSDVMGKIYEIASQTELYVLDVPVFGENLFDMAFFETHKAELERVYELLADTESKAVFENVIRAKLFGKTIFMTMSESERIPTLKELLKLNRYRSYADLGAYNGDTVKEFLGLCPGIEEIYAFEPDPKNYKKLCEYAKEVSDCKIHCFEKALWNERASLSFDGSGNRNSNINIAKEQGHDAKKRTITVEAVSLDDALCGAEVDFIKYDVEGAEKEALEGAKKTIREFCPDLMVSLYHRSEDIFSIPLQIHQLNPEYKLYLRRFPYIPCWDLNLFAIADKK